jgi:hypothetical protein
MPKDQLRDPAGLKEMREKTKHIPVSSVRLTDKLTYSQNVVCLTLTFHLDSGTETGSETT